MVEKDGSWKSFSSGSSQPTNPGAMESNSEIAGNQTSQQPPISWLERIRNAAISSGIADFAGQISVAKSAVSGQQMEKTDTDSQLR